MRIVFCTVPSPGHMYPMTTLARRVRARGHEVFFAGVPDCEPFVRASGFELCVYGAREFPLGSTAEWLAGLSRLHGLAGIRRTVARLVEGLEVTVREAPGAIRTAGADALVWDEVGREACLVAAQLGVPFLHVANALPLHRYDAIPPPLTGWRYRGDLVGRWRNRVGYGVVGHFVRPLTAALRAHGMRLGVELDKRDRNAGLSRLARISQMPAAFDFPNPELPSCFHHTGPFHDGSGRPATEFPWERLNGQPLIYASMGTVQNGAEHVFRTIARACSGLGCQVVISLGSNVAAERAGPFPGDCIAVRHAPQLEMLARAAVCVTHAGMNTVLESLAAGVPMVAIPVTNDQPGVAARVAHSGTGLVLPYRRLSVERLRRAVGEVLRDGRYRESARRLQGEIRAVNGLEQAANIVEGYLAGR